MKQKATTVSIANYRKARRAQKESIPETPTDLYTLQTRLQQAEEESRKLKQENHKLKQENTEDKQTIANLNKTLETLYQATVKMEGVQSKQTQHDTSSYSFFSPKKAVKPRTTALGSLLPVLDNPRTPKGSG